MATDPEQATTFQDQQQTELADYDEDDQFAQDQDETQQTEQTQYDSSSHPNGSYANLTSKCFKDFMLKKRVNESDW